MAQNWGSFLRFQPCQYILYSERSFSVLDWFLVSIKYLGIFIIIQPFRQEMASFLVALPNIALIYFVLCWKPLDVYFSLS